MLFLASTSPRRHALLHAAGIEFTPCRPGDEVGGEGSPREKATARAESKASQAEAPPGSCVLGVDTVVELDGEEFGKPRDRVDARRMIERLAGREHRVHTAHHLVRGDATWTAVATSTVRFDPLTPDAIEFWLDLGSWEGKAGGYGIQDAETAFASLVDGDEDTVVGLSIAVLRELLRRAAEEGPCPPS
ncbi:MAG: Maf family protein [Planctomycetes bacterium]|nr:Maf family protein [Planctomycetota bacterium]